MIKKKKKCKPKQRKNLKKFPIEINGLYGKRDRIGVAAQPHLHRTPSGFSIEHHKHEY